MTEFTVKKEKEHIKVEHTSKDFSFRLRGTQGNINNLLAQLKTEDGKGYFRLVFVSIKLFVLLSFGNPLYFQAWADWHTDYFKQKAENDAVTESEDQEILKEQEQEYYEEQELKKEEKENE